MKIIAPCDKCRFGVPFTRGHNCYLPRQLEYPGLTRATWLFAGLLDYESDPDSEAENAET